MTTKAETILRLLNQKKENNESLTLCDLVRDAEMDSFERTKKILTQLRGEGYISFSMIGNVNDVFSYKIEEKTREYFEKLEDKAKDKEEQQAQIVEQRRHNWKIALFSTIGGSIAGLITSLIFWLITK